MFQSAKNDFEGKYTKFPPIGNAPHPIFFPSRTFFMFFYIYVAFISKNFRTFAPVFQ